MSHDPPFLEVGTKISGKFKGAFCEAVINRVDKKIKVSVKRDSPATGVKVIEDRHIPNVELAIGTRVDVVVDGERVKGTISGLKDSSTYYVVFTDGDRTSLRRTQLIIMGGRHFASDVNLDSMPLTNPEHFSAPVVRPADARRSGGAGPATKTKSKPAESDKEEEEDDDERSQPSTSSATRKATKKGTSRNASDDDDDDEEEEERQKREAKERRKAESAARRERENRERLREKAARLASEKWKQRLDECWKLAKKVAVNRRKIALQSLVGFKKIQGHARSVAAQPWRRTMTHRFINRADVLLTTRQLRIPDQFVEPHPTGVIRTYKSDFRGQSRSASEEYLPSCRAVKELLKNEQIFERVRQWLLPQKAEKRTFRFAVTFTDPRMADSLQGLIREWLTDGREDDGEPRAPIDFRNIGQEQIEGMPIYDHFMEAEWYPAVLQPDVHIENGQPMREIQNMVDGTVERVEQEKVVPFECVPDFREEDFDYIFRRRPSGNRKDFKLACKFVSMYLKKELDHNTLRIMLRFEHTVELKKSAKKVSRLSFKSLQKLHSAQPTDPDVVEEEGGDEDDDSDDDGSDSSILNASTEVKDRFLATLMQSHDSNNTMLDSNPQIQGHDVDLFYLYNLALRIGAPRKVYSARPWKQWARKLVPEAVNAGPELEAMFRSCLETYMNISAKLSFPMEQMMVTSERRVVLPGQYSENRKKRETALSLQQDAHRGSVSGRGRGGAKAARGGARKRKEGSLDSNGERKRARQEDSSRATTSSPGPSEDPSELRDDDDDGSIAASEDSSRNKKKSGTPRGGQRRAAEDGVVKKGRPRKAPQEVRMTRPGGRNADRALPVDPRDPEYCKANVLSDITKASKIRASYQDQWFNGNATEVLQDFSFDLLTQMLYLQDAIHTSNEVTVREETFREVQHMWVQMNARTHYSGWNSRYDEFMPFAKLMVTKKDQHRARRRFRKLPGGESLRAETIAIVEARFCTEKEFPDKPDYEALAREAYATDEYDQQELKNIESIIRRRGGKSPARVRRLLDSDESEEEMEEEVAPRRVASDSEEEEEEPEVREPERKKRQKRREPSDENSPELGEKSTSPSAKNSRAVSPESEESSGLQREGGDSRDVSVELGERSRTQSGSESKSRSGSKTPTPRSEDKDSGETTAPDYEYEAPQQREKPAVEDVVKESSEAAEAEAPQAALSDSDADEPRYPSLPKSPFRQQAENPEEESGPMEVEEESAADPIKSPQPSTSTSSIPAAPSTSGPLFPLQSSGPLTLDSVPPTSGPLEKFDDGAPTSSSHDIRFRSNPSMTTERPSKRQRRASERSGGSDDVTGLAAKRNVLHQQFSSGALTLDSIAQEPSGPIVPMPTPKGVRRNTASPQISNSGPLTASGPLTLAPPTSSSEPVLVANAPLMPPPKAQIGRPRKSPAVVPVEVRQLEEEEPQLSEPGPSTSAARALEDVMDMEDTMAPAAEQEEPVEQAVTPRGSALQRGGARRKRGRGGFAAQRTPKSAKRGSAQQQQQQDYMDDEEERATPQPTPTHHHHPRGEGFVATKNRMAAEMEAAGTSRNYHELGLEDIDVLLAQSPMDVNLVLEEKTAELRDAFHQYKYEFQMWEKRWRRQEAARVRREEEEATRKAAAAAEQPAESPDSNDAPPNNEGPSTSGFVGRN